MTIHLFNPWHDEALAAYSPLYYPSKRARQLAAQWALLPLLWAKEGDVVIVPDIGVDGDWGTSNLWGSASKHPLLPPNVRLLTPKEASAAIDWTEVQRIEPWGWDPLIVQRLRRMGAPDRLLPSDPALKLLRQLSSRATTTALLPRCLDELRTSCLPLCGQSTIVSDADTLRRTVNDWQSTMVKSLWSCSGRGVTPLLPSSSPSLWARVGKWIASQGGVEVQRLECCQHNFALLFNALPSGAVEWCGASLFSASETGGYQGNAVLAAPVMHQRIESLLPAAPSGWAQQVAQTLSTLLTDLLRGHYVGPLGIDMMTTTSANGAHALMPCVEVNLRCTMGHAARHLAARTSNAAQQKELAESLSLGKLFTF